MLHFKDEFETENIKIIRHNIGSFGVNTYILICRKTRHAAIVDPGGAEEALIDVLKRENATVDYMLFTHAHIDHIYGAEALKCVYPKALISYHQKETPVVENIPSMCAMFRMPLCRMPSLEYDLEKNPEFSVGEIQIRSILTPGHTPGGVCFYIAEDKLSLTGDTLFKGSVGRTDFEGGSGSDLRKSLDLLMQVLPDDVQILPGHGRYSTIGNEKENNFYLRVDRWR